VSRAALAVLTLALLGCPARKETLADGGSLDGPVTFRISFLSSHSNRMYLQTRDGPDWLTVADAHGATLETAQGCDCLCEACGCAACGPSSPRAVQVPQNASTSWTWSGFEYPKAGQCSGRDCRVRRSTNPGKYTARFCYGYSFVDADGGGQLVDAPMCQDVAFDYPGDGGVVLDVCDC
jgi:hypothetical protein